MKNKIIDAIGFIIIIYSLSLGFTLLQAMLDVSSILVIFVILPMPYFLAIYMYKGVREIKHDSAQIISVLEDDIDSKDKQIANYKLMDDIRIQTIRKLELEITELKKDIDDITKVEKVLYNKTTYEKGDYYIDENNIKWICVDVTPNIDGGIHAFNYHFDKEVPFNEDVDTTDQTWICPDCKSEMTRQSSKMVYCDNILCYRKQWKKSDL